MPEQLASLSPSGCVESFPNGTEGQTIVMQGGVPVWTDGSPGESITTLVNNGDGTYTYTDENGVVTVIDVCAAIAANCDATLAFDALSGSWTFTSNSGATVVFGPFLSSFFDNEDGSFDIFYTDGSNAHWTEALTLLNNLLGGNGNVVAVYTDEQGNQFDIEETVTVINDEGDGTFTFTDEAGDDILIDFCGCPTPTATQFDITNWDSGVSDFTFSSPAPLNGQGDPFTGADFGRIIVKDTRRGITQLDTGVVAHGTALTAPFYGGTVGGSVVIRHRVIAGAYGGDSGNVLETREYTYYPIDARGVVGTPISMSWHSQSA